MNLSNFAIGAFAIGQRKSTARQWVHKCLVTHLENRKYVKHRKHRQHGCLAASLRRACNGYIKPIESFVPALLFPYKVIVLQLPRRGVVVLYFFDLDFDP